jgi:hypothetical protein
VAAAGCLMLGTPSAYAAKKWSGPQPISDPNEGVAFPEVAINGKGHAVAVWNGQAPTGEIESLRAATTVPVSPRGAHPKQAREIFGPPVTVGAAGRPAGSNPPSLPSVAVDRRGNALVAWLIVDAQGNTRVVTSFQPDGGTFGAPQMLSEAGQPAFNPDVAFDRGGDATIVWNRFQGTSTRVQAVTRSADGELGEVQTLSPAGIPAGNAEVGMNDSGGAAHLAVSPNGTAIAAWRETRQNLLGQIGTALTPDGVSFNPEIVIEPQAGMDVFEPRVGMDRFGRATLLWIETPPQATPGTNVVHTARTNRKGVFTSSGTLESANVDTRGAVLAVARAGNAAGSWVAAPSNGASEIHAAARTRRNRQFGPPETLSPPEVFGSAPSVATNRRTGVAVWDTTTGGPATDVFANFYRRR